MRCIVATVYEERMTREHTNRFLRTAKTVIITPVGEIRMRKVPPRVEK
jgi:hypothetical protein